MTRLSLIAAFSPFLLVTALQAQAGPRREDYTLPNGLRVFLVEDHTTPLVTVNVWYRAGSRYEQPGKTGIAHLFERLMYRGSAKVADGQHFQLVSDAGGESTGNVGEDRSTFSNLLPSNQLALGLWLEADRMRSLAITEQTFTSQREQSRQEREARVDNQPYASAFLDGVTLAFDSAGCFAYAHSAMGVPADLDAIVLGDVQAFYQKFFTPNRATLVVAGDIDPAEARRLVQSSFGDVPRGPAVTEPACAPAAGVAKAKDWPDPLAQFPAIVTAYRVPPHADNDSRALQVLSIVLGQGENSWLGRQLVKETKIAVQANAGLESRGGPGLFYAYAVAARGTTPEALKTELAAQVARLATAVTQADLDRARNQYRATTTMNRQAISQMADDVQHFALFHTSINEMDSDLTGYTALTLADLRRVAAKYLVPGNSLTLTVSAGDHAEPAGEHQHQEEE